MRARGKTSAFTLLELLVAVVITLVLVAVMLAISINGLDSWRRSQGRFAADAESQLIFDFLERDLNGAIVRTDLAGTWFAITIRSEANAGTLLQQGWNATGIRQKPTSDTVSLHLGSTTVQSSSIESDRFGQGGAWLRFITTKEPTSSEIGAPCAVSYQLLRRVIDTSVSPAQSDKRYLLFRSTVRVQQTASNAGTFETGYDLSSAAYTSASTTQANTGTVFSPATADALAANVIDFGVWLWVLDPAAQGGLRRIYPDAGGAAYALSGNAEIPDYADVMVRILTDEGATRLRNIETGRVSRPPQYSSDEEWWWGEAVAHSRIYTRRIKLNGGRGV